MEKKNLYNGVTIKQSWTLLAFAKTNGLPKFKEYINKDTGESFSALNFPDAPEGKIFCHFGNSTEGMTMRDIVQEASELRVGLNSNGKYTLYKEADAGTTIQLW